MSRPGGWPRPSAALGRFVLGRVVVYAVGMVVAMTGVFALIHLGPFATNQLSVGASSPEQAMLQREALNRPLGVQYVDFWTNLLTFDFGTTIGEGVEFQDWEEDRPAITGVNTIVLRGLARTAWLWGVTAAIVVPLGIGIGLVIGRRGEPRDHATVSGALLRATPMLVVAVVLRQGLIHSEDYLFGFDWNTFLIRTAARRPFFYLDSLTDPLTIVGAVKITLPYALALGSAFLGTMIRVGQRAVHDARATEHVEAAKTRGVAGRGLLQRHLLRNAARPLVATLGTNVGILIGGTMIVESLAPAGGFGTILVDAIYNLDRAIVDESFSFQYRIFQAAVFVVVLLMVGAKLLEDVLLRLLDGPRTDEEHRANTVWTGSEHALPSGAETPRPWSTQRLQALGTTRPTQWSLIERLRSNPRPALVWIGGVLVLVAVEFGAVVDTIELLLPWGGTLPDFPTLLSREVIPNRGHQVASGAWQHTFLGVSPATAWAIRVGGIYLYAAAWIAWGWVGYYLFRKEYRVGGSTPLEAVLGRFRSNAWGMAGLVIVVVVVVAAVFAPAMGPTPLNQTYSGTSFAGVDRTGPLGENVNLTYFNEEEGTVVTTTLEEANKFSASCRPSSCAWYEQSIGPLSYDDYDRFHPFGTDSGGGDLFSEMLTGARVYLIISVGTMVIAGLLALVFALLSSYYGGVVARGVGVLDDGLSTAPVVLMIALLSAYFFREDVFSTTPTIIGLGFVTLLFGVLFWPDLWRTMRGPAAAVLSEEWVGAEREMGQRRRSLGSAVVSRLVGWFLVYGVLAAAGAITTTAALSTIWRVELPVPPEWGSEIYTIFGAPWHTVVVPALALALLLIGLTALADGIRAAIDPTGERGVSSVGEARGAGGGG